MQRSVLGLGFMVTILGCQAASPELGESRSPVVNGFRQTGASEVVAVVLPMGLCSGTLFADYAVLTAKHCVYDEEGDAIAPTSIAVFLGHDVTEAEGIVDSSAVVDLWTTAGSDIDSDIANGNDVAVLLLAKTLGDDRRSIRTTAATRGESVRMVGFGRIYPGEPRDDDSGVKYEGSGYVNEVGSRVIEVQGESNVCQGDSGGPLIGSDGRVIGVASYGYGECHDSGSYYSRVDRHASWINEALDWVPPCDPNPPERCGDSIDNDCNGSIDEGCTALGLPCSVPDQCANGRCEEVGSERVCVRDCDPSSMVPNCPFGFYCEAADCGEGRCVEGDPGGRDEGEECSSDEQCESNSCVEIGDTHRCGRQCIPETAPCTDGHVCETSGASCGGCVPVEFSTGPRSFGAPCETADQCESEQCIDEFCTRDCDESDACPGGYHCRAELCVYGPLGGAGDPCLVNDDCGSTVSDCVDADGEMICAGQCESASVCPPGLECAETSLGLRCLPPGLALGADCSDHSECRSGICAGTCTRLCESSPCPDGFSCLERGEHSGCFPTDVIEDPATPEAGGGGCTVSAGGPPLVALGLLFVACARRRR